jgi:hypothetical protein
MKIIPYFYYTLAILSLIAGFILMANSITPVYFLVGGLVSALCFATFGALAQLIIDTYKQIDGMVDHVELHTVALKRLTRSKRK